MTMQAPTTDTIIVPRIPPREIFSKPKIKLPTNPPIIPRMIFLIKFVLEFIILQISGR